MKTRLYFVKDGKRKQVASWSGKVTAGAWHDVKDATFASGGKVGVWTKADSVTYFDDLMLAQH